MCDVGDGLSVTRSAALQLLGRLRGGDVAVIAPETASAMRNLNSLVGGLANQARDKFD